MSNDQVRFPAMRAEAIGALESLVDTARQERYWIKKVPARRGFHTDLSEVLASLYDDSAVLPDPDDVIGDVLASDAEANSLKRLGDVLDALVDRFGNEPDSVYLQDPRWPTVVARARSADNPGAQGRVLVAPDDLNTNG